MFIFRGIAIALIVFALMLRGADTINTLESNGFVVVRSLAQVLMLVGLDANTLFASYTPVGGVNVAIRILSWPGWATLGILGVILAVLTYLSARKTPMAAEWRGRNP